MKCQRCSKQATMHFTEVTKRNSFDEIHLCEDCASNYLRETQANNVDSKVIGLPADKDGSTVTGSRNWWHQFRSWLGI